MKASINTKLMAALVQFHHEYKKELDQAYIKYKLDGWAPSHIAILVFLQKKQSVSMQELAIGIQRDKSTLTVLIRKLLAAGYIEKNIDPEDRRSMRIASVRDPSTLLNRDKKARFAVQRRLLKNIDKSDRIKLLNLLHKL